MIKRVFKLVGLLVLGGLLSGSLLANNHQNVISFKGKIKKDGSALNGYYDVKVKLVDENDESVFWEDEYVNTQFTGGVFSIELGTDETNPITTDQLLNNHVYIKFEVGNDTIASRLAMVPYSIVAKKANEVEHVKWQSIVDPPSLSQLKGKIQESQIATSAITSDMIRYLDASKISGNISLNNDIIENAMIQKGFLKNTDGLTFPDKINSNLTISDTEDNGFTSLVVENKSKNNETGSRFKLRSNNNEIEGFLEVEKDSLGQRQFNIGTTHDHALVLKQNDQERILVNKEGTNIEGDLVVNGAIQGAIDFNSLIIDKADIVKLGIPSKDTIQTTENIKNIIKGTPISASNITDGLINVSLIPEGSITNDHILGPIDGSKIQGTIKATIEDNSVTNAKISDSTKIAFSKLDIAKSNILSLGIPDSAYNDLKEEGFIDTDSNTSLLTREKSDARYINKTEQVVISSEPKGSDIDEGSLYIHPLVVEENDTIFGIAIGANSRERFKVDTEGDIFSEGNLEIEGTLKADGYHNTSWDSAYSWGNHALVGYTNLGQTISGSEIENNTITNEDISSSTKIQFEKLDIELSDILELGVPVSDTKLTESEVDAYVANNGYVEGQNDYTLAGQISFTNPASGTSINSGGIFIKPSSFTANNVLVGAQVGSNEVLRLDTEGDLTLAGTLTASGYNKSNWDTAYSWGNHALAGYTNLGQTISGSEIENNTITNEDISSSTKIQFEKLDIELSDILELGVPVSDTKLTESEVDAYVANNGYVDGKNDYTLEGQIVFTSPASNNDVDSGAIYIEPSSFSVNKTLMGARVGSTEVFRLDTEGDLELNGGIIADGYNKSNWDTAYTNSQAIGTTIDGSEIETGVITNTHIASNAQIDSSKIKFSTESPIQAQYLDIDDVTIDSDELDSYVASNGFISSAYSDLVAEGKLDQNSSTSLLTRSAMDARYIEEQSDVTLTQKVKLTYDATSSDLDDGPLYIEAKNFVQNSDKTVIGAAVGEANPVQIMKLDADGDLELAGTLTASGYNKSNWDEAYSWGDHADDIRTDEEIKTVISNDGFIKSARQDLSDEGYLNNNEDIDILIRSQSDDRYLLESNNLSDLTNATTARTNLGLGSISTESKDSYYTRTESDARYALESNNLSDLTDKATARSNLGLGDMALQNKSNVDIDGGTISNMTSAEIDTLTVKEIIYKDNSEKGVEYIGISSSGSSYYGVPMMASGKFQIIGEDIKIVLPFSWEGGYLKIWTSQSETDFQAHGYNWERMFETTFDALSTHTLNNVKVTNDYNDQFEWSTNVNSTGFPEYVDTRSFIIRSAGNIGWIKWMVIAPGQSAN